MVTEEVGILERWREYFGELFVANRENVQNIEK